MLQQEFIIISRLITNPMANNYLNKIQILVIVMENKAFNIPYIQVDDMYQHSIMYNLLQNLNQQLYYYSLKYPKFSYP